MTECYICGNNHQHVLQEHHLIPQRLGGSDEEENLVTLCANCHNCIESLYDDDFFERVFEEFTKYRRFPRSASGRPPTGLTYNQFGDLVPGERFDNIWEAIGLRQKGVTLRQIENITGVPRDTVSSAVDRIDVYREAAHYERGDQ